MGAEEERIIVKRAGQTDEWSRKVDRMPDEKVIEVYLALKESGHIQGES